MLSPTQRHHPRLLVLNASPFITTTTVLLLLLTSSLLPEAIVTPVAAVEQSWCSSNASSSLPLVAVDYGGDLTSDGGTACGAVAPMLAELDKQYESCLSASFAKKSEEGCLAAGDCVRNRVQALNYWSIRLSSATGQNCHWFTQLKIQVLIEFGKTAEQLVNSTLYLGCQKELCRATSLSAAGDACSTPTSMPAEHDFCSFDLRGLTPTITSEEEKASPTRTLQDDHTRWSSTLTTPVSDNGEEDPTKTVSLPPPTAPPPPSNVTYNYDWARILNETTTLSNHIATIFEEKIFNDHPTIPLMPTCPNNPIEVLGYAGVTKHLPSAEQELKKFFSKKEDLNLEALVDNVEKVVGAAVIPDKPQTVADLNKLNISVLRDEHPWIHYNPPQPPFAQVNGTFTAVMTYLQLLDTFDAIKTVYIRCWPAPTPQPTTMAPPLPTNDTTSSTEPSSVVSSDVSLPTTDAIVTTEAPSVVPTPNPFTPPPTLVPTLPPNATFPPEEVELRFTMTIANNPENPFDELRFQYQLADMLNTSVANVQVVVKRLNYTADGDVIVEVRYPGPDGPALQDRTRSFTKQELDELGIRKMAPEHVNPEDEEQPFYQRSNRLVWVGGVCAVAAAAVAFLVYNSYVNKKKRAANVGKFEEQEMGLVVPMVAAPPPPAMLSGGVSGGYQPPPVAHENL